jgi:hypothetical protein
VRGGGLQGCQQGRGKPIGCPRELVKGIAASKNSIGFKMFIIKQNQKYHFEENTALIGLCSAGFSQFITNV